MPRTQPHYLRFARALTLVAGLGSAAGCGGPAPIADATPQDSAADTASDTAPPRDVTSDAGADARADVVDAGPDVLADTGPDVLADARADVPVDTAPDVREDVPVPVDVFPPPDAADDAAVDAVVPDDAVADAGAGCPPTPPTFGERCAPVGLRCTYAAPDPCTGDVQCSGDPSMPSGTWTPGCVIGPLAPPELAA